MNLYVKQNTNGSSGGGEEGVATDFLSICLH